MALLPTHFKVPTAFLAEDVNADEANENEFVVDETAEPKPYVNPSTNVCWSCRFIPFNVINNCKSAACPSGHIARNLSTMNSSGVEMSFSMVSMIKTLALIIFKYIEVAVTCLLFVPKLCKCNNNVFKL